MLKKCGTYSLWSLPTAKTFQDHCSLNRFFQFVHLSIMVPCWYNAPYTRSEFPTEKVR